MRLAIQTPDHNRRHEQVAENSSTICRRFDAFLFTGMGERKFRAEVFGQKSIRFISSWPTRNVQRMNERANGWTSLGVNE